jgi:thymidylate synthase
MLNGNVYKNELGYIQLMKDVLKNGVEVPDRTGVGSIAMFDAKLIYEPGVAPLSTLRPAPLRMAFEEMWFFMNGKTQTKELEAKGVNFWQGNTTRAFLDSRGLTDVPEGDMGKAYGHQWRQHGKGVVKDEFVVDQLVQTYETLKKDPYSRRLLTTFWQPNSSQLMALTPCHYSHQIVVLPNEKGENVLNLKLTNRSLDTVFGALYALGNYYLYQLALAKLLNMKMGALSLDLTQVHIYKDQIEYANEIVTRKFGNNGYVSITKELNTLDDMLSLKWEDIDVKGLLVNDAPFKTKRPNMAV